MSSTLRIHEICNHSRVNGPGVRAVVWVQGCSIGCKGCFNPETHPDRQGGTLHDPQKLGRDLGHLKIDGITVSGGEPLDQAEQLVDMVQAFRKIHSGTALLYSGYTVESIVKSDAKRKALLQFDAALVGPYLHQADEIWHGKKLLLLTGRISPDQLKPQRRVELIANTDSIHVTGFPTERMKNKIQILL